MSFNWWKRPEAKPEVKPQSKSHYAIKIKIEATEASEPEKAPDTGGASGNSRTAGASKPSKEVPTHCCGQEVGYAS
jgi:hypothetical protein